MKTLSAFALKALSSVEVSGQTARVTAQLDRKLYLEVNAALEALGGKWSRKLRAHVFDGKTQEDVADTIEQVLLSGGFSDKKQDLGQFFTPAELADRLVELANVKPDMHVLEPSAGRGAIVEALLRVGAKVFANEIDPENAGKLGSMRMAVAVEMRDFLTMEPSPTFSRIVMNPPFARGADIDHVLHAFKCLAPGGRLVSVMGVGVTFRQDKKSAEFRAFVKRNAARDADPDIDAWGFLTLPDGSFAAAGTNVRTVVVVLERAK